MYGYTYECPWYMPYVRTGVLEKDFKKYWYKKKMRFDFLEQEQQEIYE